MNFQISAGRLFYRFRVILNKEGIMASFRRILRYLFHRVVRFIRDFFKYYVVYLYKHTMEEMDESKFALSQQKKFSFHLISCEQEAEELASQGFDDISKRWSTATQSLQAGAIAFCVFDEYQLVHIGWLALSEKAKNSFDPLPYQVNFSSGEACTGGTWTWPEYRGSGLMKYGYFKRFQFLWDEGITISRNSVGVDNVISQKVHSKFTYEIYAVGRYLKIGKWYLKKESPIKGNRQKRT